MGGMMVWVVGIGIFLFLLLAFPKQIGAVILLIIVAIGALYFYLYQGQQARARKNAMILATAGADQACGSEYPLQIKFTNTTSETLLKVNFDLYGYRPGYSDAVVSSYLRSSDRIMKPGDVYSACWRYPEEYGKRVDHTGLDWVVRVRSTQFANEN